MLTRWPAAATALALTVTLAGCATSTGSPAPTAAKGTATTAPSDDLPSRLPPRAPSGSPAALTCQTVPDSSGPLAQVARLTVSPSGSASPGGSVAVSATVIAVSAAGSALGGLPRVVTTPAGSALLILQDGKVVGRTVGTTAPEVPLTVGSPAVQPAQALPSAVKLEACAGAESGLGAGRYEVVGVLSYRVDPLNSAADGGTPVPTGSRGYELVSAPAPLTIS